MSVRNATGAHHFSVPPKPIALEAAYRKAHGLPGVRVVKRFDGSGATTLAPLHAYEERYAKKKVERARQLIAAAAESALRSHSSTRLVKLKSRDMPSHAVYCMGLEHYAELFAVGTLSSAAKQRMQIEFGVTRDRNTMGGWVSETFNFESMVDKGVPLAAQVYAMAHFQWASWHRATHVLANEWTNASDNGLAELVVRLHDHGYTHTHSHFGAPLRGALRVLGEIGNTDSSATPHADVQSLTAEYTKRFIPYEHPMDLIALRLNPWQEPSEVRQHPLLQAVDAHALFDAQQPNVAARVAEWAGMANPFFFPEASETPRITMDAGPTLQAIERMIDLGTYALREAGDDAEHVANIADNMWALLSNDYVYPYLAYFNSTRLAMGILRDAQSWDGVSIPAFTPALAGFAKVYRDNPVTTVSMLFNQTLDPLRWYIRHPHSEVSYGRAVRYLQTSKNAGCFAEGYAKNMEYSVRIAQPDHAVAAIVVHEGGGES